MQGTHFGPHTLQWAAPAVGGRVGGDWPREAGPREEEALQAEAPALTGPRSAHLLVADPFPPPLSMGY